MNRRRNIAFEDALHDDWSRDAEVVEVPLGNRPLFYLGIVVTVIVAAVMFRVLYLNLSNGAYYEARAASNAAVAQSTPAPRGLIYDREGDILAENQAAFLAILDASAFIGNPAEQSSTLVAAQSILGLTPDAVWALVASSSADDFASPIVLSDNVTQNQLVNLQALALPTIQIQSDFERVYPKGPLFASIVGYTGRVTENDLKNDPSLGADTLVGQTGIEEYYDSSLEGVPGVNLIFQNAQGAVLGQSVKTQPTIGTPLQLTVDGGLQQYFSNDLQADLDRLNRTVAIGIAMDPQTGAILSLVNLPSYDDNLFSNPASNTLAIQGLFTDPDEPLFNRAVSGQYNPGSTIKPLDAVGGLTDGVITPDRSVFSPGYLLVPDPYDSSTPTKYLDWQYQGFVNVDSALAQSSDVFFYLVGGGSPASTPELNDPSDYGIAGLGIDGLHKWWQTFGLGKPTDIDLPGEAPGFLPTPAWWQAKTGKPWLLGDTYNVSIGQGDLLLTPIQLIDYISAIANGGEIYKPFLNASSTPQVEENLTSLLPAIQVVQQGMVDGVALPKGTAHSLSDLPFQSCAKTGSAQIDNNKEENALFVGYAPCNNPQIAILILIENSVQGSLNAVPVGKDVLNWYYENRLNAQSSTATSNQ